MRFASLLLLGLLATGLHAESLRVMRPVQISYQAPPDLSETLPMPTVPPDEEAAAVEHEIIEADPLSTSESAGCECDNSCECCPQSEGCAEPCCPCDCRHGGCGGYGLHGHRCAYCSRCNMPQHMPYRAEPSLYYYFRPYNYFQIPLIQQEAVLQGATMQNPYDTDVFQEVYGELEGQMVQSNQTLPTAPPTDYK